MKTNALSWDIFCRVIDNFGDIGVSWRLARQLRQDYQQTVRLWVDDLKSLACIAPQIKPELARQLLHGVEICHWQQTFTAG
ncbi:MAG TPA: elongation factor P maturation arginine rhamnosyltransferase EarP, partial [Nitrosomonas sp.]|nr:elongation factor P maturation arginine rhamnosyltransferase EarP [Nitrosomonas sp.]